MKHFSISSIALGAALLVAPAALADSMLNYTINGTNFSADITLYADSTPVTVTGPGNAEVSAYTVDAASGTFSDASGTYSFGVSPTVAANGGSAYNLANNGAFVFDNLIYPELSGNQTLDWGGLLIDISGAAGLPSNYELNLFAGAFGSGAAGDSYYYFADNGSYYGDNAILNVDGGPASDGLRVAPEPESLKLFGSGLLGFAGMVRRKALKPRADQA